MWIAREKSCFIKTNMTTTTAAMMMMPKAFTITLMTPKVIHKEKFSVKVKSHFR